MNIKETSLDDSPEDAEKNQTSSSSTTTSPNGTISLEETENSAELPSSPSVESKLSDLRTTETIIAELKTAIAKGNGILLEECLHDCHELIDVTDEHGMTLLLLASKISDPECVRILLENGSDVHAVDKMGRSGLHWVLDVGCHCETCSNKNVKCLELLIQYGANPNAEDFNGEIPLHFAAKNMLPKCAQTLLDNGADIDHVSKAKHVGYMMVQKIPEVLRSVLDKGILYDEQDSSKIKLDFGWILNSAGVRVSPSSVRIRRVEVERGDDSSEKDVESQQKEPLLGRRRETDLLIRMLRAHRSGREALLTHPWTEAFLHLKWLSVSKWFWIIRFVYGFMLILYSFFIFNIFILNCPPDEEEEIETTITTPTNGNTVPISMSEFSSDEIQTLTIVTSCETSLWMNFMGLFVGLSACAMIFNEIYEFIQDRHAYVQTYLNVGWWMLIISIFCTIPPAFGVKPRQWQYPMASFGLFLAWGMNLTQIGRIPSVGVYVEMLGKVLKDFVIFLLTYASLMIAFSLGMCVMFPKNEYFKSVPLGFIKSLLMMIAHLMYVGFIFIITIVLMNLLLGLAVSDIQELRKHSTVTRITRQISQIVLVESLFYSKFFPQRLATKFFPTCSADSHIERYFRFSPTDPDDRSLPEELKQKFVPYLTSSPCLNKQAVERKTSVISRWKAARRSSIRSSTKHHHQTKEENPRKLLLLNLNESVSEIKKQLKELVDKIESIKQ